MESILVASLPNRETAVRDLKEQEHKIVQQRELIGQLARNGQPTDRAKDMLGTLERTHSIMELELRRYPTPH